MIRALVQAYKASKRSKLRSGARVWTLTHCFITATGCDCQRSTFLFNIRNHACLACRSPIICSTLQLLRDYLHVFRSDTLHECCVLVTALLRLQISVPNCSAVPLQPLPSRSLSRVPAYYQVTSIKFIFVTLTCPIANALSHSPLESLARPHSSICRRAMRGASGGPEPVTTMRLEPSCSKLSELQYRGLVWITRDHGVTFKCVARLMPQAQHPRRTQSFPSEVR